MAGLRATTIAAALVTLVSVPATAQHFGLLAGPTFSTLHGSFVDGSTGSEVGVNFRLTFDARLAGNVSLATGLGIVQKGGAELELSPGGQARGFRTMYLQLPLLIRPEFEISASQWFIAPFAGPAIGFAMSCSVKPADRFEFEDSCDDTMPGGEQIGIELSAPIGFNIWKRFPGGSRFQFEVRYEAGFTNVLGEASDLGQSARNSVFSAMLGFAFPLYEIVP